ncbi:putative quinol monooxygenase [Novipirellula sp. SH528]|uniref:putative quinol monooxygenase n=1 Tax=Novipirellula sp. SH528 TaxID=3454466 RepID=UPI003FA08E44
MFVVAVQFTIKPEFADVFRERVLQQANDSLANEDACQQFEVSVDPEDANQFFLYEIYDDAAAFDQHRAADYFHDFSASVGPWVESKSLKTWHRIS